MYRLYRERSTFYLDIATNNLSRLLMYDNKKKGILHGFLSFNLAFMPLQYYHGEINSKSISLSLISYLKLGSCQV